MLASFHDRFSSNMRFANHEEQTSGLQLHEKNAYSTVKFKRENCPQILFHLEFPNQYVRERGRLRGT
jgi:hypothetical protein